MIPFANRENVSIFRRTTQPRSRGAGGAVVRCFFRIISVKPREKILHPLAKMSLTNVDRFYCSEEICAGGVMFYGIFLGKKNNGKAIDCNRENTNDVPKDISPPLGVINRDEKTTKEPCLLFMCKQGLQYHVVRKLRALLFPSHSMIITRNFSKHKVLASEKASAQLDFLFLFARCSNTTISNKVFQTYSSCCRDYIYLYHIPSPLISFLFEFPMFMGTSKNSLNFY